MSLYRFGAIIMYTAVATVCIRELIPVGLWMRWSKSGANGAATTKTSALCAKHIS